MLRTPARSTKKAVFAAAAIAALSFIAPIGGGVAQAQTDPSCYLVTVEKGGNVITIYAADGTPTTYGPDDAGYADGKEVISKFGLPECKEIPAPILPTNHAGTIVFGAVVAGGALVAIRQRKQLPAQ